MQGSLYIQHDNIFGKIFNLKTIYLDNPITYFAGKIQESVCGCSDGGGGGCEVANMVKVYSG